MLYYASLFVLFCFWLLIIGLVWMTIVRILEWIEFGPLAAGNPPATVSLDFKKPNKENFKKWTATSCEYVVFSIIEGFKFLIVCVIGLLVLVVTLALLFLGIMYIFS